MLSQNLPQTCCPQSSISLDTIVQTVFLFNWTITWSPLLLENTCFIQTSSHILKEYNVDGELIISLVLHSVNGFWWRMTPLLRHLTVRGCHRPLVSKVCKDMSENSTELWRCQRESFESCWALKHHFFSKSLWRKYQRKHLEVLKPCFFFKFNYFEL